MKNLKFFLLVCLISLVGCKETKVEEKIVTETVTETVIVEVEKQPTKVSLSLFAGELPLQDDNCDASYRLDMKDVCLYGINLEVTDISQLNSDRNKIKYTSELDGNLLNIELYQGVYLAEVSGYIYFDNEYVSFRSKFELNVSDSQINKKINLIPYVNDDFLKDRYIDNILLDRLLGEGTWELFDLYEEDTVYVGQSFYPKTFVYGGDLYVNLNTFNFKETFIDSITVQSSASTKINFNISNDAYTEVYINANEETEIFTPVEIFGTTWYHIDISELYTEEDFTFEILSLKDSQGNILPVNQKYTARYFKKGEIIKITSLENEQRFSFLGESGDNLQVCVETDTQPEYLMINDFKFTDNMSRSGNQYCFSELNIHLYEYSTLIKTDNNAEVVSITATGEISGEIISWKNISD